MVQRFKFLYIKYIFILKNIICNLYPSFRHFVRIIPNACMYGSFIFIKFATSYCLRNFYFILKYDTFLI